MKKLTREQKLEIYKLAKKIYIDKVSGIFGMCYAINEATSKLGYHFDYIFAVYSYKNRNYFSEFHKLKPRKKEVDSYWWDLDDTEIRIKNFDILIKKMNKKTPLYKRIINFFTNNKDK